MLGLTRVDYVEHTGMLATTDSTLTGMSVSMHP
jgi:hypothetical protein